HGRAHAVPVGSVGRPSAQATGPGDHRVGSRLPRRARRGRVVINRRGRRALARGPDIPPSPGSTDRGWLPLVAASGGASPRLGRARTHGLVTPAGPIGPEPRPTLRRLV